MLRRRQKAIEPQSHTPNPVTGPVGAEDLARAAGGVTVGAGRNAVGPEGHGGGGPAGPPLVSLTSSVYTPPALGGSNVLVEPQWGAFDCAPAPTVPSDTGLVWRRKSVGRHNRRQMLRWLQRHQVGDSRVHSCQKIPTSENVGFRLNLTEGGVQASLSGMNSCGAVWSCPSCAARIAHTRAGQVQAASEAYHATGGRMWLLTLTLRHDRSQDLALLLDGAHRAWRKVMNSRSWRDAKAQAGVEGYLRVLEVTHGENGWHPHFHILLFQEAGFDPHMATVWMENLKRAMFGEWVKALVHQGFRPPLENQGGADLRPVNGNLATQSDGRLASYLSKGAWAGDGAGIEVAGGALKKAKGGGESALQILSRAIEGEADAIHLWNEWGSAMKGRRQFSWSRTRPACIPEAIATMTDEAAAQIEEAEGEIRVLPWNRLRLSVHLGAVYWLQGRIEAECATIEQAENLMYGVVYDWLMRDGPPKDLEP